MTQEPNVTQAIVPVTAADREAYLAMNTLPRHLAADVRAGRWDHTTGMHVLARHREQALAQRADAAGEVAQHAAKLAECLAKACGDIAALLIFGNREGDIRSWTAEYAAVLNAYDGAYETPAYPRPSWQAPVHADDCEAMQRPRADCTCLPVAAPAHPSAEAAGEVVAWMYYAEDGQEATSPLKNRLVPNTMGWTEKPLYAAPAHPSADVAELVEAVAELQLAAFIAGRGSVVTKAEGRTFQSRPGPSMDDYRNMARAALSKHRAGEG